MSRSMEEVTRTRSQHSRFLVSMLDPPTTLGFPPTNFPSSWILCSPHESPEGCEGSYGILTASLTTTMDPKPWKVSGEIKKKKRERVWKGFGFFLRMYDQDLPTDFMVRKSKHGKASFFLPNNLDLMAEEILKERHVPMFDRSFEINL